MDEVDFESVFFAQLEELWADVVDEVGKQLAVALDEAIKKVSRR